MFYECTKPIATYDQSIALGAKNHTEIDSNPPKNAVNDDPHCGAKVWPDIH
jgi:hypothetical protein